MLTGLIMFIGAAAAPSVLAEQLAQTQPAATQCKVRVEEAVGFFSGVKSVNLYIDFPPDLRKALECHGHEKDCAERAALDAGGAIPPDQKEHYIDNTIHILRERNTDFPADLYPNNLTNLFLPMVQQLFAPVLPRDSSCSVSQPTMINPYSPRDDFKIESPDIANLMIGVTLISTTKPHIVVLTAIRWRAVGAPRFSHPLPYYTAIPLDESESDFKKQFATFIATVKQNFNPRFAPTE